MFGIVNGNGVSMFPTVGRGYAFHAGTVCTQTVIVIRFYPKANTIDLNGGQGCRETRTKGTTIDSTSIKFGSNRTIHLSQATSAIEVIGNRATSQGRCHVVSRCQ